MRRPFAVQGRLAAACDAAAIVVFAVVGLLSHGASFGKFAHDALPLLGGWFVVALAVRLYVRPSLARFFATWAVGVTAGVLVRALILGRQLNGNQAAFLATSLVFTLLFVVALRAVLSAAPQRVR
jgi:hypothetical protein